MDGTTKISLSHCRLKIHPIKQTDGSIPEFKVRKILGNNTFNAIPHSYDYEKDFSNAGFGINSDAWMEPES